MPRISFGRIAPRAVLFEDEQGFVKQASVLDGFAFDPFSFQQNCLTAPEVDVGRRQLVVAQLRPLIPQFQTCSRSAANVETGYEQTLAPQEIR